MSSFAHSVITSTDLVVIAEGSDPSSTSIMDSTPPSDTHNGNGNVVSDDPVAHEAQYDSQSDLSDTMPAHAVEASPSVDSSPKQQSEFGGNQEQYSDSSSAEQQDDASDDGDFDQEEDVAHDSNHAIKERSSSQESRRPPKRKLGVEEDEHILANPELYGLRRSVRNKPPVMIDNADIFHRAAHHNIAQSYVVPITKHHIHC